MAETRDTQLTVRFTHAERESVKVAARSADRTVAEYIRLATLSAAGMSNRLASPSAVAGGHGAVMAGVGSAA